MYSFLNQNFYIVSTSIVILLWQEVDTQGLICLKRNCRATLDHFVRILQVYDDRIWE